MPIDYKCVSDVLKKNNLDQEKVNEYVDTLDSLVGQSKDLSADDILALKKNAFEDIALAKRENLADVYYNNLAKEGVYSNIKKYVGTDEATSIKPRFDKYILSLIEGARGEKYGGLSASAIGKGLASSEGARLLSEVRAIGFNPKILAAGVDKALEKKVTTELVTGVKGVTQDPRAVQLAGVIKGALERGRENLKSFGVNIGYLENYYPRNHNRYKISTNKDSWISFMENNSNINNRDVLNNIFNDIVFGDYEGSSGKGGAGQSIAGKRAKKRVIEFNSPEAEFQYSEKFGDDSVFQSALRYVDDINYRSGIASFFGVNPEKNLLDVVNDFYKKAYSTNNEAVMKNIRSFYDPNIRNKYNGTGEFTGKVKASLSKLLKQDFPDNPGDITSTLAANLKVITNLTALSGSTLKALVSDFYTRAANLTYQGQSFWPALSKTIIDTFKPIPPEIRETLLVHLGIESEGLLHECMKYVQRGDSPLVSKGLKTAETLMFKYNLMNYVTNKARNLQALHMSEFLARDLINYSFNDLNKEAKRHFTSYGIGAEEWEILRSQAIMNKSHYFNSPYHDSVEGIGAKPELYENAIRVVSDNAIRVVSDGEELAAIDSLSEQRGKAERVKHKETKVNYVDPTLLGPENRELYLKLITMFNKEADLAVLHPDLAIERLKSFNTDMKRGSPAYIISDLMFQFKTFSVSYMRNYMMPMGKKAFGPDKDWRVLSDLIAGSFVVHYSYMVLNNLIKGKPIPTLNNKKDLLSLLYHSGIAGIGTDIITSALNESPYDNFAMEMVPASFQKAVTAVRAIKDAIGATGLGMEEEDEKPKKKKGKGKSKRKSKSKKEKDMEFLKVQAVKGALDVIPGLATVYKFMGLNAVWDSLLIDGLYNYLSPGYIQKKQKRLSKQ